MMTSMKSKYLTRVCVVLKNVQHKNVDWKMNVFSLSLRWHGCYKSCDGGVCEEEAVACLMMPYHLSRRLNEENHVNFTQTSLSTEFELGSFRIKKTNGGPYVSTFGDNLNS
jgi:hypothetical protein